MRVIFLDADGREIASVSVEGEAFHAKGDLFVNTNQIKARVKFRAIAKKIIVVGEDDKVIGNPTLPQFRLQNTFLKRGDWLVMTPEALVFRMYATEYDPRQQKPPRLRAVS